MTVCYIICFISETVSFCSSDWSSHRPRTHIESPASASQASQGVGLKARATAPSLCLFHGLTQPWPPPALQHPIPLPHTGFSVTTGTQHQVWFCTVLGNGPRAKTPTEPHPQHKACGSSLGMCHFSVFPANLGLFLYRKEPTPLRPSIPNSGCFPHCLACICKALAWPHHLQVPTRGQSCVAADMG